MRFKLSAATSLALTLLSTNALPAEPHGPRPTVATSTTASDAKPADKVLEVTIDPHVQAPVCRRHVPTGSRIATEVCERPAAKLSLATQQANRDILRRDIEEMRAQQMARDQARAQAQADAMRRRMSGQ